MLTAEELAKAEVAAGKYFNNEILLRTMKDGSEKPYTGSVSTCSDSDSDKDGKTSCTGKVPTLQGDAVVFQTRVIQCGYQGAGGCKLAK